MNVDSNDDISRGLLKQLEGLRVGLQADGADIRIDTVEDQGSRIHMSLLLTESTCLDCIMPKSHLESVLRDNFRRKYSVVKEVVLDDPREK